MQYPTTYGSLSGSTDALADVLANAMKGGPKGSPERSDQTDFLGEVLGKAGAKFVATPEGKDTVQKATLGIALPLCLLAFAAGYWLAKSKWRT